jgi:hypothetical protein
MQIDCNGAGICRKVIENGYMPVESFLNLYNDVLVTEISLKK